MLYLIGLGLNERGISKEGLLALERCSKIYVEGYTVDFPYDLSELKLGQKNIKVLQRKDVESNKLIKEAKGQKIALLVYGCPLFATTHISLIIDAHAQKVKTKVIYSASVFDAVSETGLQLYKFGKIASIPAWKNNYEPTSFLDIVEENQSIKAHSLLLIDIGLSFKKSLVQLEMAAHAKAMKLDKVIVCSKLGTDDGKIFYGTIEILRKKDVEAPFCMIIPSELHFMEKEALELFSEK